MNTRMNGHDSIARIEGVKHRYGKKIALDSIDLNIPAGCQVGLIGPDGVGKSTLLGLIAGQKKIQKGDIQVLGSSMMSARRLPISPRASDRISMPRFPSMRMWIFSDASSDSPAPSERNALSVS
jgi:ABC-type transporter Mla maintaining outer membrane lipid asymmetry ATPase subunit MlaF